MKETDKFEMTLEQEKIHAEIAKLMAETAKINRETVWYPMMVGAGFVAALTTVVATMVKVFF